MPKSSSVFEPAIRTAEGWVESVAREFGTDDRKFAYRALRAWLHGLRDQLPVQSCAHFAAQLPEVLRGVYYEGWNPGRVPADHDVDAYLRRFADEARVRPAEVRRVASTVTAALHLHLSGAQLSTALEQLPERLRELLWVAPALAAEAGVTATPDSRITVLENEVRVLINAVNELIHGLEHTPLEEPTNDHAAQAAHRAHQILLAGPA